MGGGEREDDFFNRRKEQFLQKLVDLGFDLITVKDFLEDKCIVEENIELVMDYMNNPSYFNQLKLNYVSPKNLIKTGPIQYQYID